MTQGIHHITAIASDPKKTHHFYTKILGLRLVKKSVNQDQVEAYHLFYGDKLGYPGMDLTFFTFGNTPPGRNGAGAVSTISLGVRERSLGWWQKRLATNSIRYEKPRDSFGLPRLSFWDNDGQELELVGLPDHKYKSASKEIWVSRDIDEKYAICAFHSARLSVLSKDAVEPVLTQVLDYEALDYDGSVTLYKLNGQSRASYLEVEEHPSELQAASGTGTVHHIAFRVANEARQLEVRRKVIKLGLHPTEVIDRHYFKSVYFRTEAGILFEIATNGPGFTVDEPEEDLGKTLALPPFLESQRKQIEGQLKPLTT